MLLLDVPKECAFDFSVDVWLNAVPLYILFLYNVRFCVSLISFVTDDTSFSILFDPFFVYIKFFDGPNEFLIEI